MLSASLPLLLILAHLLPHAIPILAVTAASGSDPRSTSDPFWNSRGSPENRLFCPAPLPQRTYGHRATMPDVPIAVEYLPSNFHWSHRNFSSLHDLCSFTGNPRGNMGGFCKEHADDTVTPDWRPSHARAILLYDPALDAYCRANCTCASSDDQYYALDLRESIVRHKLPPLFTPVMRNPWPPYQFPSRLAHNPYPPRNRMANLPVAGRKYNSFGRETGESKTRRAGCARGFVRCEGQGAGGWEVNSGQQGTGQPAKRCYCTYNRPPGGGRRPAPLPRPPVLRAGSSPPRVGALPVR